MTQQRAVKMPTKVKVGQLTYTIVVGGDPWKDAQLALGASPGKELYGHTMHETLTIALRPNTPLSMQQDTLLHECLHAITCAMGNIVEALDNGEHGEDLEENICSAYTGPLLCLLRDNPGLLAWLMATS